MIAALFATVDTVSMILTISIRIISSVIIRMIAMNIATIDILLTFLVLGLVCLLARDERINADAAIPWHHKLLSALMLNTSGSLWPGETTQACCKRVGGFRA